MDDSPLTRALDVLTLADVWELSPDGSESPRRDGLRNSPFRQDKKPSFSIFGGLCRYKDQASDDKAGGVWTFVQACRPEWSKKEIAQYLVEQAGLEWKEATPGDKKRWSKDQARKRRDAKERVFSTRNRDMPRPEPLVRWPDFVMSRFMDPDPKDDARIARLADRRGWPVDWVDSLYNEGVLRFPRLAWSEKRFSAFIVGHPDKFPIGYHQRIWSSDTGLSWLYVPFRPNAQSNDFTRQLAAYARQSNSARLVTPLPFILGNPDASLWIIAEGQWDAVTIYGLLGGFDDQFDLDVAVFGLRGAEAGPGVFLAYYQHRIRRQKPYLWLMPDNDPAGATWDHYLNRQPGKPYRKNFTEHLHDLVGPDRTIPLSRVPERYGKDFNDYYREAKPTREQLLAQLERHFPSWINQQLQAI